MKNLISVVFFSLAFILNIFSQEKNISFKMNGGIFFGANNSTEFLGLPGPKVSTLFSISKKTKLEIGLNGIPGIILGKDAKAGLCLGSTITLHSKWKVKPIIGVMLLKTSSWQTLIGAGVLF